MSNKLNLWLDLGVLVAFLAATTPALTGLPVHEWLSLALAAVLVFHIFLHWKWIVTVGAKYFKNLFHVSRLKFVVDALLFAAFTAVTMSGVLISRSVLPVLGITVQPGGAWRFVHTLSANASLVLVGLHFALNWGWVTGMFKRYLINPLRQARPAQNPQVAPVPVEINKQ